MVKIGILISKTTISVFREAPTFTAKSIIVLLLSFLQVVDLLLKRGADKEHRNVSDYTPLSLAASGGYVDIVQLLLNAGAEINSRTGSKVEVLFNRGCYFCKCCECEKESLYGERKE